MLTTRDDKAGVGQGAAGVVRTVIQQDLHITGVLLTDGEIDMRGVVDGSVCARVIEVGAEARFNGELVAESATLAGNAKGRFTARNLKLRAGANVEGDLVHQRISIEDGAEFEGSILKNRNDASWEEISKTFEIPGNELTSEAANAVGDLHRGFGLDAPGPASAAVEGDKVDT